MRLCEATHSHLFTIDGEQVQPVAVRGDPHFAAWLKQGPQPLVRGSSVDRLRKGEPFVHILDTREMPPYRANPWFRELIDRSGCRTAINVPLHKDGVLLGTMHLYRPEVRAFSDKQIALLQNFAAQAVIAMENARLLGELRERTRDLEESLEYQTATSDVLQVISRSTFDLEPVLQTVLNTAMRLCGNSQGSIFRLEAGVYRLAVDCVVNPDYHTIEAQHAISPDPDTLVGRTALAGRPVQILDALADPDYAPKDEARLGGYRTMLGVPLLREGAPIGVICTARTVVQPFTDKQIELVRTFADQAVIAIENTRLLTELRETLEQQTATAEVLGVINSSPGELTPVFDAILEKAHNLCGAAVGLLGIFDGETWHAVAQRGYEEPLATKLRQLARGSDLVLQKLIDGAPFVHVADPARMDNPIAETYAAAGVRTLLVVALRKDDALLGTISIARREPRPFSDKQIALLRELRGAGGHRDGERAAHYRDARGPRTADRDRRSITGHQYLARRSRTGVRRDARQGVGIMPSRFRGPLDL